MKTKKIPSRALRFNAALEVTKMAVGEVTEGAPSSKGLATVPVTLVALSGEIVQHWWFGPVIHDLAGMTPAATKLPLDYCHFCDEVVGFSDKQDVTSGQLVMSGQLVPFTDTDRASEIIHKWHNGVPYQASIYFDPGQLVIEEVPAGMSTAVNGKDLPGPLTVFRQWQLRGAAVCPYGMDSHTETKLSGSPELGEVEVQCKGEQAVEVEKPAEVAPEVPAEVVPEVKPETELATEAEVKPEVVPEVTPEVTPIVPPTELSDKPIAPVVPAPNGKQFLEAFGDVGGKWFAEGKSFDEAQTLFTNSLKDQVTALKKTNAEQAALLTANRGEQSPMTFSSAEETVVPKSKTVNVMPDGMAKFAANIKMPRS